MKEQEFHMLAARLRAGDNTGLSSVFLAVKSYCVRTLVKKTDCSSDDAEDLLMDALLIFRENVLSGKLQHLTNLQSYLFGICLNLWREQNRQAGRWQQAQTEVERQWYRLESDMPLVIQQEEQEAQNQLIQVVQEALGQLQERCRQLLTYAYIDQRSHQEIAELMGFASPNVVKVTRHRCHQQWVKFVEQLKPTLHGE